MRAQTAESMIGAAPEPARAEPPPVRHLAAVPAAAEPAAAPPSPAVAPLLRKLSQLVRDKGLTALFAVLSIAGVFLFWYVGTKYKLEFYIRFKNVPTPADVLTLASEAINSNVFFVNIVNSLRRILIGFAFATALGLALGLLIGRYRRARELLMPAIEVLRPIPAIAWVPMAIMLWPSTESSIAYITFIGAFFPILLNTVHGVQTMDGVLLRAGRCLGASELQLFRHVILPGVMPNVFTGLAIGMGVAWVSLIAAEMISGQYGVGYYTWEAYSLVNYPAVVLGMMTIGILGLLCSGLIRWVAHLVMPWRAFAAGAKK